MILTQAISRVVFFRHLYRKTMAFFRATVCTFLVAMLASPQLAGATIVRMETNGFGGFNIELYDTDAPQTVGNFLKYMNKGPADQGGYDYTLIHRSAKTFDSATNTNVPFIIQGGGYACCILQRPVHIGTDSPVPNEFSPSRSNVRGTVAMAKLPGDPNSATSEWFINLRDNSANLDTQNGGFTVFGRVLNAGMDVVDKIAAQSTIKNQAAFDENLNPTSISDVPWVENDFIYVVRVCINSDSDGVCSVTEDLAPGGDGNGDGTADRDQTNVASILTSLGGSATFSADATMKFDSVGTIDKNTALSWLKTFASPPNQSVYFNNGMFRFLMTGTMGTVEHVVKLYDGATTRPTHYYAYGKTPDNQTDHWYDFSYDSATGTGAEIVGNKIILHFVDNQRGDEDPTVNSIIHTGGQAVVTSIASTDAQSGGCSIATKPSRTWRGGDWALVSLFLVVLGIVRRRARRQI